VKQKLEALDKQIQWINFLTEKLREENNNTLKFLGVSQERRKEK